MEDKSIALLFYVIPVSYTHLDVYKRQDMYRLLQEYFYEIEIPVTNIVHK